MRCKHIIGTPDLAKGGAIPLIAVKYGCGCEGFYALPERNDRIAAAQRAGWSAMMM